MKDILFPTMNRLFVQQALKEWIKQQSPGRLLNVGAGTRTYSKYVNPNSDFITLDIVMSSEIRVQASVDCLPFPDGVFDSVLASEVFEHLEEPKEAISEVARVLKKKGRLVMTVPFLYRIHGDPKDFFRYTSEALAQLLEPYFKYKISPKGNKMTVIMDLITTTDNKWSPAKFMRIINPVLFPLLSKISSNYFPSGYYIEAERL